MANAEKKKLSRDDFHKQKELDEARKAGTAPAEQDEHGQDINPHIPQYVSQAPWYLGFDQPTLTHQRQDDEKREKVAPLDEWERYKKGVNKSAPKAKKFRKGACTNCGAMTHKKSECVERPRKLGAKFTNKNIARDEFVPKDISELGYDGKHDRWRGYNPAEYQRVVNEYAKVEEEKRKMKAKQLREETFQQKKEVDNTKTKDKEKTAGDDSDSSSSDDEDGDEMKYAEQSNMISKIDTKNRVSVRNLRIREDTAKYLRNLDVNSSHYDPKTRTMRANPYEGADPSSVPFAGDNFIRYTGDVVDIAQRQIFAWDATAKGEELHAQADPTLAEMMYKQYQDKKVNFKQNQQTSVLEKYGGEEHLKAPPKELLMAQSEHYVEYSKLGRVIKGQEKAVARSKYLEDQHQGNHTSVWGSFWYQGKWGFACCHSCIRESFCTGERGKEAASASDAHAILEAHENPKGESDGEVRAITSQGEHGDAGNGVPATDEGKAAEQEDIDDRGKSLVELHKEQQQKNLDDAEEAARKDRKRKKKRDKKSKKHKKRRSPAAESDSEEEDEDAKRAKKIKQAMEKQKADDAAADKLLATDERSRGYGAISGSFEEPTEEEMEAFRLRQQRADDPMAQFMSKD